MLRHIVMWKIDTPDMDASYKRIKESLESLVGKIEGLREMQVGRNITEGGFDLCLTSVFDDEKALEHYRVHPLHKAAQQYIHSVVRERVACDYLFE